MEIKLSIIQKSAALKNEPNLSASDFDKQLLRFVKDYCSPFEGVREFLSTTRIAATVEKETKGLYLPLWPFDTCYVGMDIFWSFFLEMYLTITWEQEQFYDNDAKEELFDLGLKPPYLNGLFAWDKVRNIVHINNKQLDNSHLDCPCSSLAKLPQWAICFNTVEQNLLWNERPVAGVIFYRYFLIKPPAYTYNKGLHGYHKAYRNKVNTIIIYHDGTLDIGPFLDLYYSGSVKNYFYDTEKLLQDKLNKTVMDFDYVEYTAACQTNNSCDIFNLLAYFLENLDKIKNAKGEKVSFAPNPKPVKTKKGYRLFGSDSIHSYYLD